MTTRELPAAVLERYSARQSVCFCGVLPEIGRAWAEMPEFRGVEEFRRAVVESKLVLARTSSPWLHVAGFAIGVSRRLPRAVPSRGVPRQTGVTATSTSG